MAERPLLFSGSMVCALLDCRKTQTRRIVKLLKGNHEDDPGRTRCTEQGEWLQYAARGVWIPFPKCPQGVVGDRLYVKETFCPNYFDDPQARTAFRADYNKAKIGDVVPEPKWTPAIFMPRKLSRITLEITSTRVERLNDISEEDAKAEGVDNGPGRGGHLYPSPRAARGPLGYRGVFRELWDKINGKTMPWTTNPFVWVIEFRRVKP